jgi:NAD(P)-dependent dehydrogenase (short-subunit alcohol dehydrogenase family)
MTRRLQKTMLDQFSLKGKVAIVTGSTRGIGRAIAEGLVQAGASVVVNGRNAESVNAAAQEIGGFGVVGDVSKAADVDQLIQSTVDKFGRIDILINNAGISSYFKPAETMKEAEWDEIIAVNLKSVFLCCEAAARVMIPQKSGRIVNISSVAGQVALPRLLAYCAAKGGVDQITRVLAVEWASHNILVNSISPGYVDSDLTKGLRENPVRLEALTRQIPLGRLGRPQEIVGAAIYLCSDAASFVTGTTLCIDGGWLAQ